MVGSRERGRRERESLEPVVCSGELPDKPVTVALVVLADSPNVLALLSLEQGLPPVSPDLGTPRSQAPGALLGKRPSELPKRRPKDTVNLSLHPADAPPALYQTDQDSRPVGESPPGTLTFLSHSNGQTAPEPVSSQKPGLRIGLARLTFTGPGNKTVFLNLPLRLRSGANGAGEKWSQPSESYLRCLCRLTESSDPKVCRRSHTLTVPQPAPRCLYFHCH